MLVDRLAGQLHVLELQQATLRALEGTVPEGSLGDLQDELQPLAVLYNEYAAKHKVRAVVSVCSQSWCMLSHCASMCMLCHRLCHRASMCMLSHRASMCMLSHCPSMCMLYNPPLHPSPISCGACAWR